MALFDWFGSKDSEEKQQAQQIPWHPLRRLEQLDEIVEESKSIPVVIFKHSTRWGLAEWYFGSLKVGMISIPTP